MIASSSFACLRAARQLAFVRAAFRIGLDVLAPAALVGLGGLLAWTSARHAAALPALVPWEFRWPEYLALTLPTFWYFRGVAAMPAESRPACGRSMCFVAGMGLLYLVLQTGFLYLAEHMFLLHRLQHVVMHHLAPFLIALSWPGEALVRGMPRPLGWMARSRPLTALARAIQQPVLAAVLFAGLVFLWLYPPLHFDAMVDSRLYAVMDWSMVVDGIFFFCLILDPRPAPPSAVTIPGRILLALSVQLPQVALGTLLLAATADLYPWYDLCGRVFPGIGAAEDQQLGALVILFGGGMMSALAALVLLGRLWRQERVAVAAEAARV